MIAAFTNQVSGEPGAAQLLRVRRGGSIARLVRYLQGSVGQTLDFRTTYRGGVLADAA